MTTTPSTISTTAMMEGHNMTTAASSTYNQASFNICQTAKLRKTQILICKSDRDMVELCHVKSPYPGMLTPYDKTHFALPQWRGRTRERCSAGAMSASTPFEKAFVRIVPKSDVHEVPPATSEKILKDIRRGLRCIVEKCDSLGWSENTSTNNE
jgi:hypothetical protein